MRLPRSSYVGLLCALVVLLPFGALAADRITVFAPSSLTDVVAALTKAYGQKSDTEIVISLAGSAQLARQVASGAPADVIISAHPDWMDYLVSERAVDAAKVRVIASNRLVIAVRREVENWADPLQLLKEDRFAMGEPDSVPAGKYAREALQTLGTWDEVKSNAVFGENVRIALFRLVRGEVGAAIVYESDLALEPAARAAYTFEGKTHSKIQYLAAPVSRVDPSKGQAVEAFLKFLTATDGQEVFAKFGFLPSSTVKP